MKINVVIETGDETKVDLLSRAFGYFDEMDGKPNPETKEAFVKRRLREFVTEKIRQEKANDAYNGEYQKGLVL